MSKGLKPVGLKVLLQLYGLENLNCQFFEAYQHTRKGVHSILLRSPLTLGIVTITPQHVLFLLFVRFGGRFRAEDYTATRLALGAIEESHTACVTSRFPLISSPNVFEVYSNSPVAVESSSTLAFSAPTCSCGDTKLHCPWSRCPLFLFPYP